jgi:hypothetical protein
MKKALYLLLTARARSVLAQFKLLAALPVSHLGTSSIAASTKQALPGQNRQAAGDRKCSMVPQAHQTTSFIAQLVQGSRAAPDPAGPSAEDAEQRAATAAAVQLAFEAETQAAITELQVQAARQQQMVGELECGYAAVEQQQQAVSDALASLAAQLDHVSGSGSSTSQPLVSLGMPNGYAEACSALLESLTGYVQHHFPGNDGNAGQGAAAQYQQDSMELQQLQSFLCKAERLRVEEEAEMAR